MSNKCCEKIVDTARKLATDAIKIASKRAIQKTAKATGNLVGNKTGDKITSVSKKSLKKPRDEELLQNKASNEIPKEQYISPKERQQIIDQLRLIQQYDNRIPKIANLIDDTSKQL